MSLEPWYVKVAAAEGKPPRAVVIENTIRNLWIQAAESAQ